ncbi:hypothetical protein [Methyloceanibacter sp.]|uniref:hypothetical protein n=1 Tax=Methyloceanibacter sp. TaxID=1965321 RepID=UPI003F4F49CA
MMAIHDCIGGLAPEMDIIADAVRVDFVKCHEGMPVNGGAKGSHRGGVIGNQ